MTLRCINRREKKYCYEFMSWHVTKYIWIYSWCVNRKTSAYVCSTWNVSRYFRWQKKMKFVPNKKKGAESQIKNIFFSLHRTQPLLLLISSSESTQPSFHLNEKKIENNQINFISFPDIFFIFPLLAYAIISLHLNVIFFLEINK